MYSQIYISNLKNETLSRLNYVKSIGAGGPASRRIKSSNLSDLVFLCAEGMTTQSYLNLQHVPFMSANRTKTNGSTEKTHRPVTERNLYGKKVDLTGRETPRKKSKKKTPVYRDQGRRGTSRGGELVGFTSVDAPAWAAMFPSVYCGEDTIRAVSLRAHSAGLCHSRHSQVTHITHKTTRGGVKIRSFNYPLGPTIYTSWSASLALMFDG